MCIFYIQQNSTGSQNAGSLKIESNTEVKMRAHSKHQPDITQLGSQNAGSNQVNLRAAGSQKSDTISNHKKKSSGLDAGSRRAQKSRTVKVKKNNPAVKKNVLFKMADLWAQDTTGRDPGSGIRDPGSGISNR